MPLSEHRTLIIAEAGVNHNGDLELAKALIDVAAEAGADIVKFQTFKAEKLVSPVAEMAAYQKANTGTDSSQFQMLKKLELDRSAHEMLMHHCAKRNIRFLSTAFDLESIDLLDQMGLTEWKIPSGEITNRPYLAKIASLGRSVILSTGMSTLGEIEDALNVMLDAGLKRDQICILHCNTEYPTPMTDVNLRAMLGIRAAFQTQIGYSDHTLGIEVPIAAVAMGAVCIEKHFTLDQNMEGPDHKASLDPDQLKAMVQAIRNIEEALGDGWKRPSTSEAKNRNIARKSIHLSRNLEAGQRIEASDLLMLRPGDGISPMEMDRIIGRRLKEFAPAGKQLDFKDLI